MNRFWVIALICLTGVRQICAESPSELFGKLCAPCHGKDGKGNTPAGKKVGAKDLTLSTTTPGDIRKQIVEGKNDAKGVSKMPAFGGKISDAEVQTLMDYVLSLRKKK
jgi:cytochrome c6